MKINIYYGGRGLIDDPTLFTIGKMQAVLEELHVTVERYALHELGKNITTLPQTLKEADGIILATTIEWYGIGGFMQQFLDACWLYGDKEKIAAIYMCPVVMSTTYGEREGKLNLTTAWEILGGLPCTGICGYITDPATLEANREYMMLIEKKAENMYRTINQKLASLPSSNQEVKQKITMTKIDLTPQETEQMSYYATDEDYIQTQKQDIQELTSLFKDMMGSKETSDTPIFLAEFEKQFRPQAGLQATYKVSIKEKKQPLILQVASKEFTCYYGECEQPDVEMQIATDTINEIICGRMTFQRAFMGGNMTMKGDFKILRALDQIFPFMEVV